MWCTGGLPDKNWFWKGVKTVSNMTHIVEVTIDCKESN